VISGPLILALLQGAAGPSLHSSAPQPSKIIAVILPRAPNASMLEALYRLRGEADSVGFELRLVEAGYPGNVGYDPSGWSPGVLASAGLGLVLSPHFVVQVHGGGMLLYREPKVFIADTEVARTGRPAWLASAMLGVTF